jgi:opacity protein-like surface antigen
MTGCHRVGSTLWLALGVALYAQVASAADVPRLPPPAAIPIEPVAPVSWLVGGWYLRGDIGYRMPTVDSAEATGPFPDPSGSKFGKGLTISAGAGIKTSWLRTDFTVDYVSATKYSGSVLAANDTTARVAATAALVNGYFDLGTWYRLTPYVGAGAGAGYVSLTDLTGPVPGGDNSQWKFVWAGMAGVGWAISPNTMIDVGYRYLNLGDLHTANNGAGGMTLNNVAGHEVRVGLRWSFNDLREYR